MLLTVKDACELHPMTLEYSMSEQVENLSDVIAADTAAARAFYLIDAQQTNIGVGTQFTAAAFGCLAV